MADTKWCPQCGAEYVPVTTTCADCHVPLVEREPQAPARDVAEEAEELEPIEFDLTEWPEDVRRDLEWMLNGAGIAYEWIEEGVLVVPGARADETEGFLDYLAAGPTDDMPIETEEWRTAATGGGAAIALSVDDFYEGDPAREDSEESTFGLDWTDAEGVQCEVDWVHDTGELYLMRALKWQPFMVEILDIIPTLDEVEQLLDGWEEAMVQPNSVQWVRDRVSERRTSNEEPLVENAPEASNDSPLFDALEEKLNHLEAP